jgi:hypothetical protein
MNYTPLINGNTYGHTMIIVNIFNVPAITVQAIEYEDMQKIENVYGSGGMPISRGYGNIEAKASITLLMEEVQNILKVAPLGSLRNIPEFDIIVSYTDPGLPVVTHRIRNCKFPNNKISVKQNDTTIPVQLDIICSHIEWK